MHNDFKEIEMLLEQFYAINNEIEKMDATSLNKVPTLIMETDNEIQFQKISEPKITHNVSPKSHNESESKKQLTTEKKSKHKKQHVEQEFYNALIEASILTKKNSLSSLYGYKYGFEISSPKKISVNLSKKHLTEQTDDIADEFPRPPEFIPFQNFDFFKSGHQKRKNTTLVKKFFTKLKRIYFKAQ